MTNILNNVRRKENKARNIVSGRLIAVINVAVFDSAFYCPSFRQPQRIVLASSDSNLACVIAQLASNSAAKSEKPPNVFPLAYTCLMIIESKISFGLRSGDLTAIQASEFPLH